MKKLVNKKVTITLIFVFLAFYSGFYAIDEHMAMDFQNGNKFWNSALSWDLLVPFSPGWVWVYIIYFPICFFPISWIEIWENKFILYRYILGLLILNIIAYIIFWLFPSHVVRPTIEGNSINEMAMEWVFKIDPGFNVFPSLHVADVAYIACVAWRIGKRPVSFFIWIFFLFIGVSTLFVKQHYILDLPAGFVLAMTAYYIAFSRMIFNPFSKVA